MAKELDFDRIMLLLNVIVECGKHGPLYQAIAAEAQKEMKQITESLQAGLQANKQPTVMPAEGGEPRLKTSAEAAPLVDKRRL